MKRFSAIVSCQSFTKRKSQDTLIFSLLAGSGNCCPGTHGAFRIEAGKNIKNTLKEINDTTNHSMVQVPIVEEICHPNPGPVFI